jgi:hypothetical protein
MCGNDCRPKDSPDFGHEHGVLSASWGYWSNGRDMTQEECHLCELCFGKVRDFIVASGGKVREIMYSMESGPNWHKKYNEDYKVVDGLGVSPMLREKVIASLEEEVLKKKSRSLKNR